MRILIIEDEKEIRESLIELLEFSKFEIHTAKNGHEGMKMLAEVDPHLIITDILMPEKDGYEVLMELRKNKDFNDIPVLVISALAANYNIKTAEAFGAASYLIKPFSADEFFTQIELLTGISPKHP